MTPGHQPDTPGATNAAGCRHQPRRQSTMDIIEQLSSALADRLAGAATSVVALKTGPRHRSGILWRPDVVVTSEQVVGDQESATIIQGGTEVKAKLAGRDPTTN